MLSGLHETIYKMHKNEQLAFCEIAEALDMEETEVESMFNEAERNMEEDDEE